MHPIHKNLKRVTRLVILPDYQGIGLGTKLLTWLAEYLHERNMDLSINTSAKNLIMSLRRNKNWRMYGFEKSKQPKHGLDSKRKLRTDAATGRFMYRPK